MDLPLQTNNIKLCSTLDGESFSHFKMSEFQNPDGWVMVHPALLRALELTRHALNEISKSKDIRITITDCVRTPQQNYALGRRLGYTDEGGLVSRNSYHLSQYGGIAADFIAWDASLDKELSAAEVLPVAALFFHFSKAYTDGHIHGDMRKIVTR
jgi:hypothetical protein